MSTTLIGRRVVLRPLVVEDFAAWREVRRRNADWLLKWEPLRTPGAPDPVESRMRSRCAAGPGSASASSAPASATAIFVDGRFAGEINLSIVQRGPFQSAYVGYWIDEARGRQRLHARGRGAASAGPPSRTCACTGSRSRSSRATPPAGAWSRSSRSATKGIAQRYLEINGAWEDHIRYAMTAEEWDLRRDELLRAWID